VWLAWRLAIGCSPRGGGIAKQCGAASDFGKPARETEEGNQLLLAGWLGAGL